MRTVAEIETDKYERMWAHKEYGVHAPGEQMADAFIEIAAPSHGSSIIELGCGTARGGVKLHQLGHKVTLLDLTFDGLCDEAHDLPRIQAPLWSDWPGPFDYGYCVDVMEHIPPEYTMLVIDRIMARCRACFFHICLVQDGFGRVIGEPLHLTVAPYTWWRDRLGEFGTLIDARDLIRNGLFYVERA